MVTTVTGMSDDNSTPPPPPPPPPPPYGAPPVGGSGYSPVEAIKYGWEKFSKKPSEMLVPGLIFLACVIVVQVVIFLITNATLLGTHDCTKTFFGQEIESQCGPGFITRMIGQALISGVGSIVISALGAGLIKSALNIVDGRPVNAGDVFGYATRPNVLTTAALIAVATFVGTVLCILPGIIVSFLTTFAMFFVVDKDQAPVDAIKSSVSFMVSQLGNTILFFLLAAVTLIAGAILCGIGLIVAAPVVAIAGAYTFRRLHDEPVSPVA